MVPTTSLYFIQKQSTHPFIDISELYLNLRLIVQWGFLTKLGKICYFCFNNVLCLTHQVFFVMVTL